MIAAEDAIERPRGWPGAATVTAVFAAVVAWGAVHHEPWRDEVVPLSIVRNAGSLGDLLAALRFESHPMLWYVVLWAGYEVVGRTWVLKAASFACAVGAVFLLNRSALPWWFRLLVTFSLFPLYQYSVVSRGYSLEMLALFAFCALYPRRRARPVATALVLAALANTEAFGFIMAVAAGAMLLVERIVPTAAPTERVSVGRLLPAVVVYAAGLLAAAAVAFPDPAHRGVGIREIDAGGVAAAVGSALLHPAAHATVMTFLPAPSLWLWAYLAYLAPRPRILCFAAIVFVGTETLFNAVPHLGAPWHAGNVVLALVATMWLDASGAIPAYGLPETVAAARTWLGRLLAVAATVLFAGQAVDAARLLAADRTGEYSSSRRLGELLVADPALRTAVVAGEPDAPLAAVPYYADNRIFLGREHAFRGWGIYAPARRARYDLGSLLDDAERVRTECACRVVLTLGWPLEPGVWKSFEGTRFEETFEITPAQEARFRAATRHLATLRETTMTDESYDVFVLR